MIFSITAVLFGLVAISSAAIADVENVRNTPASVLETRQAANGACCIPEKSLKQDACTVNGAAGKCVPGGPAACNGALNCVANNQLTCDNAVKERSGVLCRFKAADGKIQDGAKQITSLSQAKVN
ncbi:hypothetical protein GMOD_00001645 [Pyrenophora seminiperda CCB06]|uniref:Uncharacterized protein n=1 Tax=Pyrenophora seminiperda CCB06 TaxID=1302712 RepID=A0A3M7LZK8_9PLEO|nr:hypothetical protein GMOD_00001645 [Pyrenophora seminiperda CCB06]